MKIVPLQITVGQLCEGFRDGGENGVTGYAGRLCIRPSFQREFVYSEQQQVEVVNSIFKGFPLNVMYWLRNPLGTFELLDGQQRTLSICSFKVGNFSVARAGKPQFYENMTSEDRDKFDSYLLNIYVCEDCTEQEQIDWFRIINIAGERLTNQEMLNAVYSGPWVASARQRFSKTKCVAYKLDNKDHDPYLKGSPIRQDYLETILKWISHKDGIDVETYMAKHRGDANSDREWQYFQKVKAWVQELFPAYRKEMRGVPWGLLYNAHKDDYHSATDLEEEVKRLMMDDDVTNKPGIYAYVLTREERRLSIRAFTEGMKRAAFERQGGVCPICGKRFELSQMQADHILPWSKGGRTVAENCQMLCSPCNNAKSNH